MADPRAEPDADVSRIKSHERLSLWNENGWCGNMSHGSKPESEMVFADTGRAAVRLQTNGAEISVFVQDEKP